MSRSQKRLLFFLFFLSGFCSLLYQIVWVRMCFASFGVITPVLSVVLSVFMLGLFVGSWVAGRWIVTAGRALSLSAIWFYSAAELLIGLGAFVVPRWLAAGETWLLATGQTDSLGYLLWSGPLIAASLFPWCFCMGATTPLMMGYIEETDSDTTSFSFLYLANSIGAMAGALISALMLIELLGFSGTLQLAASLNFSIAAVAAVLGLRARASAGAAQAKARAEAPAAQVRALTASLPPRLIVLFLFISGFTAMAMEVVWTRAFTIVLRTQVYSFAILLVAYLLGTWVGSARYRKALTRGSVVSVKFLIAALGVAALLPLLVNDPRLYLRGVGAVLSVMPFCGLLGYLTPRLIDEYSSGRPARAGFSYAMNVLGCILGPLFASYLLLPYFSLKASLLILAMPYVIACLAFWSRQAFAKPVPALSFAAVFALLIVVCHTYEDDFLGPRNEIRRDHTATVISTRDAGGGVRLLVNGIGITYLTPVTKIMGHLPLALLGHRPTSSLVICFGMGTTFRSLVSWGADTTAVELVSVVRDAFAFYFGDAREILARPNARVVIDDGRRFLRRTQEKFDVITLDPPPPVEAAGSSLLYSDEFYSAAKLRLKPGGILQQWLPHTERRIEKAVLGSLMHSFPYVRVFEAFDGTGGHHFLASMRPIKVPSVDEALSRMPARAVADLVEWRLDRDPKAVLREVLALEIPAQKFLGNSGLRILDDRPYNEYFLIRRGLFKEPKASR